MLPGKVAAVSQAVEAMGLRLPAEALRDIASEIEWRKVSMLSIERYAARIDERPLPQGISAEQMIQVHESYTELLEARRQIDFEDVLVLLTGMLETEPRAAVHVRERYRFFTVDEYQDVSPLQHALLKVWLGDRTDVCVVGDASQTIYGFAGASSAPLLRFAAEYPGAREFRLERNYRSTAPIVQTANRLMRDRPGALTLRPMRPETPEDQLPRVEWFATEHEEAAAVAASIRASIESGTPASEIAVLSRTNAQSARVETELANQGVGSRVHGGQRFFDRADVRQAVLLMRGQAKVADPRPLFQVVSDVLRSCGWTTQEPEGAAQRERWEALGAILSLVDEMPPGTTMEAFSEELLARQKAHHEPTLETVTLSAIHAAKGLEWSLVHVVGLSEGVLPIAHAIDEDDIDEERRLCYVAFTRARDELRLSGSAAGARAARMPSRFLAEAGITLTEH
ncbi:ATP-dependent helicase [Leucobacter sp. HNU]|uniref:ATP-dependent helicase n=1 Tax=Leucobacter sp. HNU TaxID=3236805 RepID=UPI003A80575C